MSDDPVPTDEWRTARGPLARLTGKLVELVVNEVEVARLHVLTGDDERAAVRLRSVEGRIMALRAGVTVALTYGDEGVAVTYAGVVQGWPSERVVVIEGLGAPVRHQRRAAERVRVTIPITVVTADGSTSPARTIDLSSTGVALVSDTVRLRVQEVVGLVLDLDDGPLCLVALCVGRRGTARGLAITQIDGSDRARLDAFLATAPRGATA